MLEVQLRDAAFGAVPMPRVTDGSGVPKVRLLTAIVLGAGGRYAAAATILGELARSADQVIASLAGSTFASHRRQLGGHAVARRFDGAALLTASRAVSPRPDPDGLDAEGAVSDALLGLAADNLALGRLPAARRFAAGAAEVPSGWRGGVRAGWVGAEIELAAGAPEWAVGPAERAAELAHARGARRHSIKSDLVLSAALAGTGDAADHERAVVLAENALSDAEKDECYSLIWPACSILGNLGAEHGEKYRFRRAQVLHGVLLRADPGGRRIAHDSPWVPT
jgi:hypothetical protein